MCEPGPGEKFRSGSRDQIRTLTVSGTKGFLWPCESGLNLDLGTDGQFHSAWKWESGQGQGLGT